MSGFYVDYIEFGGSEGRTTLGTSYTNANLASESIRSIDLSQLSILKDLRSINLANNRIQNIDLSPVSEFAYLQLLDISSNELETISLKPLGKCRRLENLDLSINHLLKINLSPLASCRSIKDISLSNNFLQKIDLSPLLSCTRLESISLFTNDLDILDLSAIIKLPRLKQLQCDQHLEIRVNPIFWDMRVVEDYEEDKTGARIIKFDPLSSPEVSLHDTQPDQRTIKEILKGDEDQTTEFKSSFRLDTKDNTIKKDLKYEVIRTICGFMNSKGGVLLIGVKDDKTIFGIKEEIKKIPKKNRDNYELILRQEIDNVLGRKNETSIQIQFEPWGDKEICRVDVGRSITGEVFLKSKKGEDEFWVRSGNRTKKLTGKEMTDYIRETWPELFVKSAAVDDE